MNLEFDSIWIKIAAACIAALVLWFRSPPGLGGLLQLVTPRRTTAIRTVDCKVIDHAWRTLINASIQLKEQAGVDLLNQWMASYTTRQLETRE